MTKAKTRISIIDVLDTAGAVLRLRLTNDKGSRRGSLTEILFPNNIIKDYVTSQVDVRDMARTLAYDSLPIREEKERHFLYAKAFGNAWRGSMFESNS